MVYVTRKEQFCASHRVFRADWSLAKNLEVFGACANPNFHGHNFELLVKVKGHPDPVTGYVIDLKILSKLIRTHVIEQVDYKNLNDEVAFLEGKLPSCEHLVMAFWKILAPLVQQTTNGTASLHSLVLWETERNFVEYYGE
ncbi:MAG: 6-carboxytetrahydropterin synthase [Cytophagales bacterium]|nr:MAG: 6-carboxytetrahydropterin synthase [Cytophagales bacterium]TAF60333.1 MAG: 6-carboxytetrahydropterin synthase [Cytophagales bacterium]